MRVSDDYRIFDEAPNDDVTDPSSDTGLDSHDSAAWDGTVWVTGGDVTVPHYHYVAWDGTTFVPGGGVS